MVEVAPHWRTADGVRGAERFEQATHETDEAVMKLVNTVIEALRGNAS
jgi:hypothetical protein